MGIETREVICARCSAKFETENAPTSKEYGPMIVKKGRNQRERLCEKCWDKAMKTPNTTKYSPPVSSSVGRNYGINTNPNLFVGFGKVAREAIRIRNDEIDRLRLLVARIATENIKLKDENVILKMDDQQGERANGNASQLTSNKRSMGNPAGSKEASP